MNLTILTNLQKDNTMNILVTGGAGFIGSAVIRYIIMNTSNRVLNIDKLTYAGNLKSLSNICNNPRYKFSQTDICNQQKLIEIFDDFCPDIVMNLAAETHVDKSIVGSADFINTNIIGTYTMLEVSRQYYDKLDTFKKSQFKFHHISTDEVYGDLGDTQKLFDENTNYAPSSPYSASKASSDHLVKAWGKTYGLPIIITNCSNNYGPYQFPEKLIPLTILNALDGNPLPIYGSGQQIRDWLYVDDHASALYLVATQADIGKTYVIGGNNQQKNIDVVQKICQLLEELAPHKPPHIKYYKDLITHTQDRLGHDFRYAINSNKIERELGWKPKETFETGLKKTVNWYLENVDWVRDVKTGDYKKWLKNQYTIN